MGRQTMVDDFYAMLHKLMCARQFEFKGMPKSEQMVLGILLHQHDNRKLTISQLADRLQITRPAISRTVKTLMDKEWVLREMDENDRRIIYVQATEEGKQQYDSIVKEARHYLEQALCQFGSDDIAHFIQTGNHIAEVIKSTREKMNKEMIE